MAAKKGYREQYAKILGKIWEVLRNHPGEWLTMFDLAKETGYALATIHQVLTAVWIDMPNVERVAVLYRNTDGARSKQIYYRYVAKTQKVV